VSRKDGLSLSRKFRESDGLPLVLHAVGFQTKDRLSRARGYEKLVPDSEFSEEDLYVVEDEEKREAFAKEYEEAGLEHEAYKKWSIHDKLLLVRESDLREKWECQCCGDTFRWDRNHEDEYPTCPCCASTDTERVEEGDRQ